MSKKKNWIITTTGNEDLDEVEKNLTDKGFTVDNKLDAIGQFIGSADDDVAEELRKIPGVTDVSPDTPIDIGPPGSPETW